MTRKELIIKILGKDASTLFFNSKEEDLFDKTLKIINDLEAKLEPIYPEGQEILMTLKANDQRIDKLLNDKEIEINNSANSCKDFFDIPLHFQFLKENPNFQKICEQQSYAEGKSLWLELKVIDRPMTFFLFKWMYGSQDTKETLIKGERIKINSRHVPFGCTLETISYVAPGADILKKKLQTLINETE